MNGWLIASEVLAATTVISSGLLAYATGRLRYHRNRAKDRDQLINNLSEGVYRSSIDGKQLSANRALVRLNGFSSEREMLESVNRTETDAIAVEWYVDPARRVEFKRVLHRDGHVKDFVSEIFRHKTRERIWISENARLVLCPRTGSPLMYEGTVRDITENLQRREAESRLNKLADIVPGGLFQMRRASDGSFTMPYMSQPFRKLLGYAPDQVLINPVDEVGRVHPNDKANYLMSLDLSARSLTPWRCMFRFRDAATGHFSWLDVNANIERDSDGSVVWSGCLSDVSEHKRMQGEIERLAYHDPLTDLPNRRLLLDRLTEACKQSRRRRKHGAVLFIDLDGFKAINDQYGHETGDEYIRMIGRRLSQTVRESDTVARFGGDEFVILLHDLDTDPAGAQRDASRVAEKINESLREGVALLGDSKPVRCSIGVSVFRGAAIQPEQVVAQADQAMYRAKAEGRGSVVIHDEIIADGASENASPKMKRLNPANAA
jgi:diguanylate cyclase (GGDEF)-like protein/PAS domain S-box-containing protein